MLPGASDQRRPAGPGLNTLKSMQIGGDMTRVVSPAIHNRIQIGESNLVKQFLRLLLLFLSALVHDLLQNGPGAVTVTQFDIGLGQIQLG